MDRRGFFSTLAGGAAFSRTKPIEYANPQQGPVKVFRGLTAVEISAGKRFRLICAADGYACIDADSGRELKPGDTYRACRMVGPAFGD